MTEPVSYYDWDQNLTKHKKENDSIKNTKIGISPSTLKAHMKQWRDNNL